MAQGLGYFAFPPASGTQNDRDAHAIPNSSHPFQRHDTSANESGSSGAKTQHARDQRANADARKPDTTPRPRQDPEEPAPISQSELEYVRMGFSIRDALGRVDKARTDLIRAELRKRDRLATLVEQWEAYETRWRALLASDRPIAFADVPWPVPTPPSSVDDIRPEAVAQFFVDSLKVPGNAATVSERLRGAILRWHPDKMSAIFSRTVESDLDSVREGVNVVFCALHAHAKGPRDDAASES
ncbi:hypothetical protein FKP32DRAFT_1592222 [Trametes sanguinea]|nr:hypothetical protein FKP32DRAFT_1592222 [Trametes sanguinea]